MRDRNGKKILVGNKVKWYDPQEEYRDVNRVWEVSHIYDIHTNEQNSQCVI